METLLYIVFFVSCLVLVIAVLLQPGKTDAGALFTSGVSSAALNPRGTQSVLSKITIGAAATFMLSALLLSLPALTGNRSVMSSAPADPVAATDSNVNANVNANSEANTNSAVVNASNSTPDTESTDKNDDSAKGENKEDNATGKNSNED